MASPALHFDVSAVAALRKRVGHAATSLKAIGYFSAILVGVYTYAPFGWEVYDPFGLGVALLCAMLTPGCASLIAKRLRSGSTRAVVLAAAWWALLAAWTAYAIQKKGAETWEPKTVVGAVLVLAPLYFLARGLFAFKAYRAQQPYRNARDPLALNPWEEGLRIKQHPKFLNKYSISAYGFLVLSLLPPLSMWAGILNTDVEFYSDYAAYFGTWIGYALGWLLFLGMAADIYRRARKAAMLPGSVLVKKDVRPIVLYLRSFHDDSRIKLWARATNGRILLERLMKISFEEVVTDQLWGYGPVLAIGNPQEKRKPKSLGAARDYVENSGWQKKVTELMQQASMIVAIAGGTQGLAWEIDTIARRGFISKFVLLLPPVAMQELKARWQFLASNATHDILPSEIDLVRDRAVIFPKGNATFISGEKRNDWTYEAVLDEAVLVISNEREALRASPRPAWHMGQIVADMVIPALILVGLATFFGVNNYRLTSSRPYARASSERDSFLAATVQECQKNNKGMSKNKLSKYCTCFANRLADVITYGEANEFSSDPSSNVLKEKATQASSSCAESRRGK